MRLQFIRKSLNQTKTSSSLFLCSYFMDIVRLRDVGDAHQKLRALCEFKRLLSIQAPEFADHHQKDAHEFLTAVLDQMKDLDAPLRQVASILGRSYRRPVERNLVFRMQNTRKCKRCGSASVREEEFLNLPLDLIPGGSVQQMLQEFEKLLNFLAEKDLVVTVPKATKLLQLVLTVPATTASVERSFSALKRLKTYSRNRTDQGRLSSLAVISIETERLLKLKEDKEDFYRKVTDVFVQKERRMDFIYTKRTSIEKKPPEEPSTRQKTQEDQTYGRQAHEERDEEKMNDGCTVTSKSQTPKMTQEEAKDDDQLSDAEGDWMNKTTWRSKTHARMRVKMISSRKKKIR
ncbi:unnamed protein product [Xyrichtys novacula]|uniref:Unnamed protein product n=1 Tax=Xyrichtys novacula TaxID=13765 RepID=A0AAV1FB42_XYRNO|nr:unnamed protein product [Xyrichtys novacula]